MIGHVYVGLKQEPGEKTFLYSEKELARSKRKRQVLWGDRLQVEAEEGDWLKITWSPKKNPQTLYIPKDDTQATRPLEIVFVDVGQGDGAVLFTPERGDGERVMVIDAGQGDDMHRFLSGRFGGVRDRFNFHAAIITHPDSDHYGGFKPVFSDPRFGFGTVYHSGVVERPGGKQFDKLGGTLEDPATGISYLGALAETDEDMLAAFGNAATDELYPGVIRAAIENNEILKFAMLSTEHGQIEEGKSYVPGFAPSNARGYTIEVIGPVVEPDAGGKARLRVTGNYGQTKNGHSVVLRLVYGSFSVLFGGDLNAGAERLLLAHYSGRKDLMIRKNGLKELPADDEERKYMVEMARKRLRSEVMKVCHHGSSDVTDEFLAAVDPASFVISSGDNEGHVHPRPDLLGRLGRMGRGKSPVILSTELQRSTRASEDKKLVDKLQRQVEKYRTSGTPAAKAAVDASIALLARDNVDVYGAIYLKTDGRRLITAFKYERGSDLERWFYYEYALLPSGVLRLVS